jgi:ubiquinone/menaquinone biosynthesis C-methylase UbiE
MHAMSSGWTRASLICVVAAGLLAPLSAGQLASRPAAEWIKLLDSPERVAGLQIDQVIAKLQLKPGTVVADLGAGSGSFSLPFAGAVGPTGKVYAVEVDQVMVEHIRRKAAGQRVTNIETVLGKFADPALPAADVDIAFLHDVLHHIADRAEYLKRVPRYLKPAGRIAIIEFHPHASPHRDQSDLLVSKEHARALMNDVGFIPAEEFPLFEDRWFVIYARR